MRIRMSGSNFKVFALSVIFAFTLILSGCSYHVAGSGVQGGGDNGSIGMLPGNVSSVAIPFFENRTKKPRVEGVITSAVANEFMSSVDVVDVEKAEAILVGAIESYRLKPVSFSSSDVVQEYRLYVTISVALVRAGDEVVLWKETHITDYEDFVVDVNDITFSNDAEWEALRVIAFDMARLVKERILEGS